MLVRLRRMHRRQAAGRQHSHTDTMLPILLKMQPESKCSVDSNLAHLMLGLVQHKPPRLPRLQQGSFLEENAFKTPARRTRSTAEMNGSVESPLLSTGEQWP